jgi:hypothetical protein
MHRSGLLASFVFISVCALAWGEDTLAVQETTPTKDWLHDFAAAQKKSEETGRPILWLATELDGCQDSLSTALLELVVTPAAAELAEKFICCAGDAGRLPKPVNEAVKKSVLKNGSVSLVLPVIAVVSTESKVLAVQAGAGRYLQYVRGSGFVSIGNIVQDLAKLSAENSDVGEDVVETVQPEKVGSDESENASPPDAD